jgi:hypothetical protein
LAVGHSNNVVSKGQQLLPVAWFQSDGEAPSAFKGTDEMSLYGHKILEFAIENIFVYQFT